MRVINAPHSSMTPVFSITTRMLVMPAVNASVSRSRIMGMDTTDVENTSAANTPPTTIYTATKLQFCGLNTACSTPVVDGMPVLKNTANTTRDARLEARVSAAQKFLLQQAAALSGRTLSEFVVASAQDAARRVIAEHESIRLSREEQLAFVQSLLNPVEPNQRLKRAAKAYRQRTGS